MVPSCSACRSCHWMTLLAFCHTCCNHTCSRQCINNTETERQSDREGRWTERQCLVGGVSTPPSAVHLTLAKISRITTALSSPLAPAHTVSSGEPPKSSATIPAPVPGSVVCVSRCGMVSISCLVGIGNDEGDSNNCGTCWSRCSMSSERSRVGKR